MTLISANSLKKVHVRSRGIVFSKKFFITGRTSEIIYNILKGLTPKILATQLSELKKSMHIYKEISCVILFAENKTIVAIITIFHCIIIIKSIIINVNDACLLQ